MFPCERTYVRRAKRKTTVPPRPKVTARVNEQITAQRVRVVAEDGTQVGVLPVADAREHAAQRSLDLIEVAAESDPPVCRLGDYGRWPLSQAPLATTRDGHLVLLKENGDVFALSPRGWQLMTEPPDLDEVHGRLSRT